jgi:hypothetical protein
MSTGWERVSVRARMCGKCGRELVLGDPIFVYSLPRPNRPPTRLIRCDSLLCAGPAPPDLPPLVKGTVGILGPVALLRPWADIDHAPAERRKALLAAIRGVDREPGEEG